MVFSGTLGLCRFAPGISVMVGGKTERTKKKEYGMLVGDVEKILTADALLFKSPFSVDIWFRLLPKHFARCTTYYVILVIDRAFKI